MKTELIFGLIVIGMLVNIYTEGKFYQQAMSYQKYYKMAGIAFGAFIIYKLLKRDPNKAREMLGHSREYLNYMHVDGDTSSFINPILDFTRSGSFSNPDTSYGTTSVSGGSNNTPLDKRSQRILASGRNSSRRSVSESKKKFVAARQQWKCGHCRKILSAWYEIDHKTRLEFGGNNSVENLVALCRECHGQKTAMENF